MKNVILSRHLWLCMTMLSFLCSCEFGKSTFGGTQAPSTGNTVITPADVAKALIASKVTLFHLDSTSVVGSPSITQLTNLKTSFEAGITGPLNMQPDGTVATSIVDGVMHFEPSVSQSRFISPVDKGISGSSASLFMVVKSGSNGDLVSFNAFDAFTQGFNISLNGTTASGIFYSSATDYSAVDVPFPASGLGIVGASFGQDGEIDFSVNGVLNSVPVLTGTPGTPFSVPRILALGPLNIGEQLEVKEVYVFGRTLTKIEQGAMIIYLGQKHGVSITLDPLLNVPTTGGGGGGGTTTDPNFAPAQAIIENKCIACHSSWSGVRASYYTNLGLVNKNDPTNSKLYYRLSGSAGSNGPKTMPQGGSISASEVSTLENWITHMP